jgi:E3 ubiquitin-protein ligase HERC4
MSKVYCFGNTSNGELGLGGIEDEHILLPRKQKLPIDKKYKLRQLSSGRNHTLVLLLNDSIEESLVLSCGSNERLQLGRSGSWKRFETIDALNQHLVTRVCCGANHSLALTEAGQIFSWGCNLFGQLGIQSISKFKFIF